MISNLGKNAAAIGSARLISGMILERVYQESL